MKMRVIDGFTFIELILYVAVVAMLLAAVVPFAWNVIETGIKSSVQQEVTANGRFISERIVYEIRNASGINSVSATAISLATTSPATNPTVIDLSGGNIRITQGTGNAITLNSSNTVISDLLFTNLTSLDNKTKHIMFALTVDALFTTTRQEYQNSITIETSAELRSN
jgi:Tfp pilus assembly protein PilE